MNPAQTAAAGFGLLVLAACGTTKDPHHEAIVAACAADGWPEAECACTAGALKAALDKESFAAFGDFAGNIAKAESDEAKAMLMFGAMSNPKLVLALEAAEKVEEGCKSQASPGDAQPARTIEGVYMPRLNDVHPSERRLAAAAADKKWEFSGDGTVVTYSQRGAVKWAYEVHGDEIRLVGADRHNSGERRRFTFTGEGGCIWDGSGRSSVDMRFCP